MQKFIKKTIAFISPLIIIGLFEMLMPIDYFTHRPWEALLYRSGDFPFYPNQVLKMKSVGGLGFHTPFAVEKNEYWKTDKLGYRNNYFIKKADVLIIGDSFIAGSSVTQDSTLANQIMSISNEKTTVYSLAPATFNDFVNLLNQGIIEKPKLLILSIVERNLPPIFDEEAIAKKNFQIKNSNAEIYFDKIQRFYSFEYMKARFLNKKGSGKKGIVDSKMFFVNGKAQKYDSNYLLKVFNSIKSYKQFCDKENIVFMFLPMPDKETVYFDLVPFKNQRTELLKLDSLLTLNGIYSINTLKVYNQYRKNKKALLYHLDDTHWNANSINLIAKDICEYARTHNILYK
tara:strand:+ start:1560 stop:2591 length:1032 start_codon:yes stop_codon:yes gene_type:complete